MTESSVDVTTETVIRRPREQVAEYASNPTNAPEWYVNIATADITTPPPFGVGTKIAFAARFLGRDLRYTYEVTDFAPGHRLVMRTANGPFPMETTYAWESVEPALTRMTLRNRGAPAGFARLLAPFVARMMRSANEKDLARLKTILERQGIAGGT